MKSHLLVALSALASPSAPAHADQFRILAWNVESNRPNAAQVSDADSLLLVVDARRFAIEDVDSPAAGDRYKLAVRAAAVSRSMARLGKVCADPEKLLVQEWPGGASRGTASGTLESTGPHPSDRSSPIKRLRKCR